MPSEERRPLPIVIDENADFWAAAREHRLMLQRCKDCGYVQYYPRKICRQCWNENLEWTQSSGRGKVYTYTVNHRAPEDVFKKDLPYVVAVVDLEEGPRMMSNIVGTSPDKVSIGMPVELVFDDVTPEISLPKFKPAGA